MTNQSKGYPFEVKLPERQQIAGVALADHLRSVDWAARRAQLAGKLPPQALQQILDRIATLLGLWS